MSKKLLGMFAGLLLALGVMVAPVAAEEANLNNMSTEQLIALIQQLLSGSSTTTTTPATTGTSSTAISGIPSGFQFNTNLKLGMTGNDVKYLQIVLNSDSATAVATSGVGSAGNESTYFGAMTKAAVVKFQEKYASVALTPLGLTKGTGFVGAGTRTQLNTLLATGTTTTPVSNLPAGCTSTTGFSPVTGQACSTVSTLPAGCTSTTGFSPVTGQSCAGGTTTPVVTPVTGSGMTVALASDSPSNTTLVTGQSAAPLAKFVLTNADSVEAKITKVELQRIGVSEDSTLSNVYLFNGAVRLTDAATVSKGKVTFSDPNGILTIAAGQSVVLTVSSDIDSSASGQIVGVSLTGITSNVEVKSTLPLQGSTQTIASATLATLTATGETLGTKTDPQEDVIVWQAKIVIGTRDVQMTKLALKQLSSIESKDINNFRLFIDGEEIAQVDSLDSNNVVTFIFDKTVKSGNRTVKVLADVIGGSSRIIQMSLRNSSDISATDSEYNVTAPVYTSGTSFSPVTTTAIEVNSGSVTVKKSTSSATGTVAQSATGVSLAKFELKAYGESVKISTLKVKSAVNITNATLYIDGEQYGSAISIPAYGTTSTDPTLDLRTYTVNFVAQPGVTSIVEVVADLPASGNPQITLVIGSSNAQAQTSYRSLNVPTSTVAANSLSIGSTATLTLAAASNYAAQSVVFPQTEYKIGEWVLSGESTQDVNLYTFSVTPTVTSTGSTITIRDAYLEIDGVATSVKSSIATGVASSWSTNKTIAKNGSMTVKLYGNIEVADASLFSAGSVQGALAVSGTGVTSGTTRDVSPAIPGQTITYAAASITVTKGTSSPATAIVSDEGTIQTASYQIETVNDSYVIDTFNVNIQDATAIASVSLMDGTTTLQTRPASTDVSFSGLNYTIPANTKKTLSIAVTLSGVGTGAGSTGANIITTFDASETYVAQGSTGTIAAHTGSDVAGNALYVYKTIPTISLVSLPSSLLTAGTNTIQKFTVSADAAGDLSWKQIKFTVSKSGATAGPTIACTSGACTTGFEVYDVTSGQTVAGNFTPSADTLNAAAAASNVVVTFVPTEEEAISAGQSKTYELRAKVDGTLADNDYVMSQIAKSTTAFVASNSVSVLGATPSFIWSDLSAQGHDAAKTDWATDFLVKNLPTSTQTVQK